MKKQGQARQYGLRITARRLAALWQSRRLAALWQSQHHRWVARIEYGLRITAKHLALLKRSMVGETPSEVSKVWALGHQAVKSHMQKQEQVRQYTLTITARRLAALWKVMVSRTSKVVCTSGAIGPLYGARYLTLKSLLRRPIANIQSISNGFMLPGK
jgi:hypothetical protein